MASEALIGPTPAHLRARRGGCGLSVGQLHMADRMRAIAAAGDARGRTGMAATAAAQSAHVSEGCFAKACRETWQAPALRGFEEA